MSADKNLRSVILYLHLIEFDWDFSCLNALGIRLTSYNHLKSKTNTLKTATNFFRFGVAEIQVPAIALYFHGQHITERRKKPFPVSTRVSELGFFSSQLRHQEWSCGMERNRSKTGVIQITR